MTHVSIFRGVEARSIEHRDFNFEELAAAVSQARTYPSKGACPLLKLARFGDERSANGSLRHDANLLEISGVEGDYDGEQVSLADAQMMLADAGLAAILYTSPSHTAEKPRWRVLCPLSEPCPPAERAKFVSRLNGALGGILAPESFTLSQSYYVGRVEGVLYEHARVRGTPIDLLPQLAEKAIGPTKNGENRAERLASVRANDPVIARLAERGLLLRDRSDGGADIVCPFEAEHTTPRTPADCSYWPAHTGGFQKPHFHCLHGHCAARSDEDFLRALGIKGENAARIKGNGVGERTQDSDRILNLARLPPIEYDQQREQAAKDLEIRVSTLDDEVKKKRTELAIENPEETGDGIFPARNPWGEGVDGTELLAKLVATFKRFVILPKHAAEALALWTVVTYLSGDIGVAPMLAIRSPEKRCGKSSLLGLLSRLAHRAMAASNISPSAIFRSLEKWSPTLMIDEADSFLGENDELRGILNSGHTRDTAFAIRSEAVGDRFEPRRYSTWGLKAIALIGALPDTLADRSITIELRRKMPSERVEKLRHAGDLEPLARMCLRWATDNAVKLHSARPAIPDELDDRAGDNWEPLLAVADLAGGAWPRAARVAASVLSGATADGDSTKVELLKDLLTLFRGKFTEQQALSSAELVEALTEDKAGRWYDYSHGRPLTQRQLAHLLRPFGIVSGTVRNEAQTFKGYMLEAFSDTFARYIPGFDPSHRHNGQSTRVVTDRLSVTECAVLRIEDPSQSNNGARCDGVTDENPPPGGVSHETGSTERLGGEVKL